MTIGTINFSTLNTNNGSHIINKKGTKRYVIGVDNNGAEDGDPITTILNAVEIDWNGAVLSNADIANATSKTINTTSDLLELVNEMQKEIYVLGAAVISLANKY